MTSLQLLPDDGNPLTREVINCDGSLLFGSRIQCERETITLTPEHVALSERLYQVQGWLLLPLLILVTLVVITGLVKGYHDGKAISEAHK